MRKIIILLSLCFLSISKASYNKKSCSDLLSSKLFIKCGNVDVHSYKVWNSKISKTLYKRIIGYNSTEEPYRLRMGMAIIGVDLLYHRHAESEIYYIAKGRGTTVLGHPGNQTTIDLREGTYFYIPGGMPHYTQAEPDQPLTVLYLFPRNNSRSIKYIYDDTTPLKTTSEKNPITINSISPLKAGKVFPTTIETLIKDVDLGFKRIVLSPNHDFTVPVLSDDVILYINKGHTVVDLGPSDVHLQLKEGDYLYLSQGHTFSFKGEAPLGVEVFVFGRRFSL